MDIGKIIFGIQTEECAHCDVGRCLRALLDLKNQTEPQPEAIPEPPAPKSPARDEPGKEKRHGRAARSKKKTRRESTEEKLQTVLSYVSKHPDCKIKSAAADLGYTVGATKILLADLKAQGQVESIGKTTQTVYRIVQKSAPGLKVKPPDPENANRNHDLIQCPMCNAACSSQARLDSHMRMVHPGISL